MEFCTKNSKIYIEKRTIVPLNRNMEPKITDKDLKILEILKHESSLTTRQIAKKTLLPVTTVHNRIKKLQKEGIIKGYSINLDYKKLGKNLTVYIIVRINIELLRELKVSQHEIVDKIRKLEPVEEAAVVIGEGDIVIKVRVKDQAAFDDFLLNKLHHIKGIKETKSLSVIYETE